MLPCHKLSQLICHQESNLCNPLPSLLICSGDQATDRRWRRNRLIASVLLSSFRETAAALPNRLTGRNKPTKRWLAAHGATLADCDPILLGDDLYCCEPVCDVAKAVGMDYILVCKLSSHKCLYEVLDTDRARIHASDWLPRSLVSKRFSEQLITELSIIGSYSISYNNRTITIEMDELYNPSIRRRTGTLYAKIFVTDGANPVGTEGYWLAEASFAQQFTDSGRLEPEHSFRNIDLTTTFRYPPRGHYNIFLVIGEYPNKTTVRAWVSFRDPLVVK